MRRELWEMVVDLLNGVTPPTMAAGGLRVVGMTLDLPVDVNVRRTATEFKMLVDLPATRWTDGFMVQPGRMQLDLRSTDFGVDSGADYEQR
jgi:hypothetical protein